LIEANLITCYWKGTVVARGSVDARDGWILLDFHHAEAIKMHLTLLQ